MITQSELTISTKLNRPKLRGGEQKQNDKIPVYNSITPVYYICKFDILNIIISTETEHYEREQYRRKFESRKEIEKNNKENVSDSQ